MTSATKFFSIGIAALFIVESPAAAGSVSCDITTRNGRPAFGTVDIDLDRRTLVEDRGEDLFYWITDFSISPMVPEIQFNRKTECRLADRPTTGSLQSFVCESPTAKAEINFKIFGPAGRYWGWVNEPSRQFDLKFSNCR